jgi:hypothetical protein
VIALIDGDILTYRVGFAYDDDDFGLARHRLGETIEIICDELETEEFELFITGKTNFRNDYAVTAPYKGNRTGRRPVHYDALREYMLELNGTLVEGQEADDAIAIRATELGTKKAMIVSIDKDFDQVEGWHYNFVKKQQYYISRTQGLLNFYMQFLTGDRIDNIIGVKGIGPVKAKKLLEGKTEREMYEVCVEELGSEERAVENGILLWLRRHEGEIWTPPTKEEVDEKANEKERT